MAANFRSALLKLAWIIIASVCFAAPQTFANDLQIELYTTDIEKNGAPIGGVSELGYVSPDDQISLDIEVAASWQCIVDSITSGNITIYFCLDPPSFNYRVEAISCPPAPAVCLVNPFTVASGRFNGPTEVRDRAPGGFQQPPRNTTASKTQTVNLNTLAGFDVFAANSFNRGNRISLRLVIDSSEEVPEDFENNNTNSLAAPDFVPLTGTLAFGPTSTTLSTDFTTFQENLTCGSTSGLNSDLANLLIVGATRWDPAPGPAWPPKIVALAPACARFTLSAAGDALDLTATSNVNAGTITGELAGFDVQVTGNTLDALNGATPGTLRLKLPGRHSSHADEHPDDAALSGPSPRGSMFLTLANIFQSSPTDYRVIEASGGGNWLHSEGLPFSILINTVVLTADTLSGSYSDVHYLHDRRYSNGIFSRDPRRLSGQGPRSNDRRFSFPLPAASASLAFDITPNGMNISSIAFDAVGGGLNHFPRSKTFGIPAFEIAVLDGRLAPTALPAAGRYTMALGTDCESCDSGGNDSVYSMVSVRDDGLAPDGAVVSSVADLRDPEWGPFLIQVGAVIDNTAPDLVLALGETFSYDIDNGFSALYSSPNRKHMFERSGDSAKNGVMLLPGGIADSTGGADGTRVANYLLGMRQVAAAPNHLQPTTHHPLNSLQAGRGNHFMAGLTVGPERYSRVADKQPEIGNGSDLNDTEMTIGFGGKSDPDFETLGSSVGTKYVVRPGGVTGAFNFDALPSPEIYGGYALNLERFAFRQVNNVPDEFSWIDGSLDIPGKGTFTVVFESMQLECSGDFGGGLVVREQCDGVDNNNRFGTDENCGERFTAWKAPVDFLSMAFVPDDPALPMCETQGRDLEIGNTVAVASLNEALSMVARWSPSGDPFAANITGKTDHVLDQPKDDDAAPLDDQPGFNVALASGIELKTPGGSNSDGWFETTADVGLPFWQTLDAKVRIANASAGSMQTPPSQEQTILIRQGQSLTANDDAVANFALIDEMRTSGPADSAAAYEWGSTGFSFAAPIYYDSGRHNDGLHPRFLGRTFNKDLVVLELNAGVDYVTPEATRVSFGASADFAKLTEIDFGFNIDVNDPNALQKTDNFLCDDLPFQVGDCDPAGGGNFDGPVNKLLGPVREKLSLMNLVADSGFDGFMEEGVKSAFQFAGPGPNPFALAANSIGKVQSIPQQLASQVDDGLQDVTATLINPLTATLDAAMVEVYRTLPKLYLDAAPPVSTPDFEALEQFIALLQHARIEVGAVRTALDTNMNADIAEVVAKIQALNAGVTQDVNRAVSDLTDLVNAIETAGSLTSCDFVDSNPGAAAPSNQVLGKLFEVIQRIHDVREVLDDVRAGNELVGFATSLASAAGVDLNGVSSAQQSIGVLIEEATLLVDTAFGHLSGICAAANPIFAEVGGMLDDAVMHLESFSFLIAQATGKMALVESALLDPATGKIRAVQGAVNAAVAQVELIDSFLADQIEIAGAAMDAFPDGFAYEGLLENEIQQQIFQTALGNLDWVYDLGGANEHSFVRELADIIRNPIDSAIADAASVGFAQLNPIINALPHPSAGELRIQVTDLVMNSDAVESIDHVAYGALDQVGGSLNDISLDLFDPVAFVIQELVTQFEGLANEALDAATSTLKEELPVGAARLDGYALIEGDELMRLHVGATWTMSGDAEESTSQYGAALDIVSWNANNKALNCIGGDAEGILDASISVFGVPIQFGPVDVILQELTLGFTIEQLAPVGFFGLIILDGEINFQTFVIYDVGFAAGVGKYENYLGASAGAQFDGIAMSVAFLIGKTCNTEVLTKLDPQAAEWVTFPGGIFNGVYVRGSASVPIWEAGCFLRVGVGASAGAWVLIGPPLTVGGVVSGAAYGKALCLAALRGQITVWGELVGDQFNFGGDGFGAVGIGFDCDEATWTSIPKVRADDWCGTGDASFKAEYRNGWQLGPMDTSAID